RYTPTMKIFLGGLAGLAVLAVVLAIGMHFIAKPISAKNETAPTVSTTTIKESTKDYAINVDYPQFGVPAVDEQIRKNVSWALEEFKALPSNPPDSAAELSTFDGKFDKAYVGDDVISVELELSEYTGGAHELPILIGENFDAKTGERIELKRVLPMIGRTLEQ